MPHLSSGALVIALSLGNNKECKLSESYILGMSSGCLFWVTTFNETLIHGWNCETKWHCDQILYTISSGFLSRQCFALQKVQINESTKIAEDLHLGIKIAPSYFCWPEFTHCGRFQLFFVFYLIALETKYILRKTATMILGFEDPICCYFFLRSMETILNLPEHKHFIWKASRRFLRVTKHGS